MALSKEKFSNCIFLKYGPIPIFSTFNHAIKFKFAEVPKPKMALDSKIT